MTALAFPSVVYGQYGPAGTFTYKPWNTITAAVISGITSLTCTTNLTLNVTGGTTSQVGVVYDMFLTSAPNSGNNLVQITVYLHSTGLAPSGNIGTYTDGNGIAWLVSSNTTVIPTQYTFIPTGLVDKLNITFDLKAMFAYLIAQGVITGNAYFNGFALGPQPTDSAAIGSLTINSATVAYNSSVPLLIYQNNQRYQPAGSPYWAYIEPATNAANVGPSGTPTGNQYVVNISAPDSATFPNNVTIFTNYSPTASTAPVLGFFYLIYGDQTLGTGENPSYPRPRPPNPPPAQIANIATGTTAYNFTTTGGGSYDAIYDIWFNSVSSYAPYPGDSRMYEFDIGIFGTGGFGGVGQRMFTIAGAGAPWDNNIITTSVDTGQFGWRFVTSRPAGTSGSINLLRIWRQMVWTGYASGNEWILGYNLGVEPISLTSQTTVINSFAASMVSNPNIAIAANGTGTRPGSAGYHVVGAGAGQNSTIIYPNAASTYNVRRLGANTLVRTGTDFSTMDVVQACDKLQFNDGTKIIANLPAVADKAFMLPLPFIAGQTIGTVQATNLPTSWIRSNGDPNNYFAISSGGALTLTAAGAAALSPALYSVTPSSSFTTQASPGTAFRITIGNNGYSLGGSPAASNSTFQVQVKISTTSASVGGTIDSVWIGTYAGSNGTFSGTPTQLFFSNNASQTLANGANTYTTDVANFAISGQTICVGFHVTGSGVRLSNVFPSGAQANCATFWITSSADVGGSTATFPWNNANGGQLLGLTEIDVGLFHPIELEVQATNATGSSIGCVVIGNPGYTAFSIGGTSTNITLTNNSLTATAVTATVNGDMASTSQGMTFYKWYAEMTVGALDGVNSVAFGFRNAHEAVTNTLIGASIHSIGAFDDGHIATGASTVGQLGSAAVNGDVICMAIDFDLQLGWWRLCHSGVAGLWNNNAAADPAAGTGGINVNPVAQYNMPATGKFIVGGPNNYATAYLKKTSSNVSVTINSGRTDFAFICPSGFTGWKFQ